MRFGDILRNLIDERDMTQKQLASELKISPSTLGGYVQNTREPDFDTLKMFAQYFDVSLDYLLNNDVKHDNSTDEKEILRIFRSLTKEQKQIYLEQGKAFIKINNK